MSIVATTLSAAIGTGDTQFAVASATNITAPNFSTGAGITYLFIDQEYMIVLAITGTTVQVARGVLGTPATTHANGALVQSGLPSDFAQFGDFTISALVTKQTEAQLNWPSTLLSGVADAVPATVAGSYIIKTGSANAMTIAVPPASAEGNVIMIYSDTLFAHTLTAPSAIFARGTAAVATVATWVAFRGAGMILRVVNGTYQVMSNVGPIGLA